MKPLDKLEDAILSYVVKYFKYNDKKPRIKVLWLTDERKFNLIYQTSKEEYPEDFFIEKKKRVLEAWKRIDLNWRLIVPYDYYILLNWENIRKEGERLSKPTNGYFNPLNQLFMTLIHENIHVLELITNKEIIGKWNPEETVEPLIVYEIWNKFSEEKFNVVKEFIETWKKKVLRQ